MTKTLDELKAAAEAVIRIHPGIELIRFATKLGLPITYRRSRKGKGAPELSDSANRDIRHLIKAGVIKVQDPTPTRESILVYPANWQPKTIAPSQTIVLQAIVDHSLITPVSTPVTATAATVRALPAQTEIDRYKAKEEQGEVAKSSGQARRSRTSQETQAAVRAVLEQMKTRREVWSRNKVLAMAGVSDSYFHGNLGMRKEYDAAIAVVTGKQQPETEHTAPSKPQPDQYQQRLEAEIKRLLAENEALKMQIRQPQPERSALTILQAEQAQLKADIEALNAEIDKLSAKRNSLVDGAVLLNRLIDRYEQQHDAQAETNGHRQEVAA